MLPLCLPPSFDSSREDFKMALEQHGHSEMLQLFDSDIQDQGFSYPSEVGADGPVEKYLDHQSLSGKT